jgi:crotonobetainyl-CoA:carnitine CoA-transferase CaiB-like acyl-CoA transferase
VLDPSHFELSDFHFISLLHTWFGWYKRVIAKKNLGGSVMSKRAVGDVQTTLASGKTCARRAPSGPLLGVKVLDLATVVAAPFAATLMADLGAEVLKVELPGAGDHIRHLPPHKDGVPLWSKVANRNKRGITLDLRTPEGRNIVEKLIAEQDVLVENFRPGTLDRWGLSAERLFSINPHLIILRITGFGQNGPYASRPGFARVFEAMSGFAHLNGNADGPPIFPGYPISDAVAGVYGAFSVCAALVHRNATPGRPGQEIDLSATESMFRCLDFLAIEYDQLGSVRKRNGNLNAYSAPSDIYKTSDGEWMVLAVSAPTVFARFAKAIERPDLLVDQKFSTNVARLANRGEIEGIVRKWFSERTQTEVADILRKHDVTYNRIFSIEDIFKDQHFEAREAIVTVDDDELGPVRMQGVVPKFSRTPGAVWRAGPAEGEHNNEVFETQLQFSHEEIASMRGRKVI